MYRYLLFIYDAYYPSGGMRDVALKFNDVSELVKNKDDFYLCDYIEIYDIEKDKRYFYDIEDYDNSIDDIFDEFMADILK